MKIVRAIMVVCGLTAGASAAVADVPRLHPSRDVDVTYRAERTPQGPVPLDQRVRWLAQAQMMRIDPPGDGLHVIIDYAARRMSVVRDATHSVVDMAAPDNMTDAIGGRRGGGSYLRGGETMVAGLSCTEWQTLDRAARPTTVCITDDGVLLRVRMAGQTMVSAIAVKYAPQDPTAFRVPSDYTHNVPRAAR